MWESRVRECETDGWNEECCHNIIRIMTANYYGTYDIRIRMYVIQMEMTFLSFLHCTTTNRTQSHA